MIIQAKKKEGKNGYTLVFIHGNSMSSDLFADFYASNSDYSLILLDLPGHGNNRNDHNQKSYEWKSLKSQLIDALSGLNEPYLLIGHSLGGHLCSEVLPHIESCIGLVLIGAPPIKKPLNMDLAFMPLDVIGNSFKSELTNEEILNTIDEITYNTEVVDQLVKNFKKTDPLFREVFFNSAINLDQMEDEVEILERSRIPTFAIHGLNDPVINLDYLKGLKVIRHIYEINNCGHYPSIERPEQFRSIINKIVEKVNN